LTAMAKRKGRKLPEVLTGEEQKALLSQPNPRYPTGERNRLLMRLMLDAGLRVAEALALRWEHIDLMSGKLMVREGKGAKDRTLWLGKEDLKLMRHWRERQAKDVEGHPERVFTTLKGKPVQSSYVRRMVKRYAKKAGIPEAEKVSPHTLRHTFATDLYRETKNIRLVQKALGHSSLSTTMIYTHIVDEELEGAMKNFRNGAA